MAADSKRSSGRNSSQPKAGTDIAALKAENERLKRQVADLKAHKQTAIRRRSFWRAVLTGVSATAAVVLFMLFNISFWAQRTVINNQQFTATVAPIIRDPAVQKALQQRISDRIFSNIDVEARLKEVLPENLDIISAPLANQVRAYVTGKIGTALQSEQVANAWTTVVSSAHAKLMEYISNPNYDGIITVDDVYNTVGSQLQNSQVGFLFGKNLPNSIGNITVKQVTWLPEARQALDTLHRLTRQLALGTVVFAGLAISLSRKRAKMTAGILAFATLFMLITLTAIRFGYWASAQHVASEYQQAVRAIYKIITAPLVDQTQAFALLLGSGLLIVLISSRVAWVAWLRRHMRLLFDKFWRVLSNSLPTADWLAQISANSQVIAWTLVVVSYVTFALRLPPTTSGVITAVIISAISVLLLELIASYDRVARIRKP